MTRALLLTLALWAALAATASADVYDDNPATASRGDGDQWVFARAGNGETLVRHWTTAGRWSDWETLGGSATSGPAAVGYGQSILVFVRGSDGGLSQQTYDGTKWLGWSALGGYLTSAPAVSVRRGLGYVDVAARGGDNSLVFRSYVPGQGWSDWASQGGNITSGPAMNSQADGLVNIWARATDGSLVQKSWMNPGWSEFIGLGGGIIGAPQTVARMQNTLNVYVRGGGNATFARSWNGAWSEWALLDQLPVDSSPAAGADGPNREWLLARKGDRMVRKEWTAANGWQPWTDFGPVAVPPPPPPAPGGPAPTTPDGAVNLETGVRCTPPGGRLRVSIKVRKPKGKGRARVSRIVFYTKGKGRKVRSDRKSPFVVRIQINRPAGSEGRVYARVYYRRTAKGKLYRKTVSRRYTVCR